MLHFLYVSLDKINKTSKDCLDCFCIRNYYIYAAIVSLLFFK